MPNPLAPRPTRLRGLMLALALLALAACNSGGGGPSLPNPLPATISGDLRVAQEVPSLVPERLHAASRAVGPDEMIVPGDFIVALEPALAAATLGSLQVAGVPLEPVRTLPVGEAYLLQADVDAATTRAILDELRARPDVLYAEPNRILEPTRVPNDAYWVSDRTYFWHYDAIDLPAAWDVTIGSASTVIAVIDTGILVDPSNPDPSVSHPDLVGKVLPGRDFISDPASALDGDGRDGNAYDVGDQPLGPVAPSYHGTHVAGTIAAATDNGVGMPGVNWNAKILPVRVLGFNPNTGGTGGTIVDIVDGALWAAGLGSANPTPADVLNLSLGGAGACSVYEQAAFDAIAAAGVVTVVAAGNNDDDAGSYTPSSCRNVIAVGATALDDERAWYSNYGSRVDVMAPGGETRSPFGTVQDVNGDGVPDGVVSTLAERSMTGDLTMNYVAYQGTSMAAPHVAGVAGLMLALDPTLTPGRLEQLLRETARPLSGAACGAPTGLGIDCGAGLTDVPAALAAVQAGGGGGPVGEIFTFDPEPLDFGSDSVTLSVDVTNQSASAVNWSAAFAEDPDNPAELVEGWLSGDESGFLAAGATNRLTYTVHREDVLGLGAFAADLVFFDPADETVHGRLLVQLIKTEAFTGLSGPTYVEAYVQDLEAEDGWALSGAYYVPSFPSAYTLTAQAGASIVAAWVDENLSEVYDEGDYIGYTDTFYAAPGASYPNKHILLERVVPGPDPTLSPLAGAGPDSGLAPGSGQGWLLQALLEPGARPVRDAASVVPSWE